MTAFQDWRGLYCLVYGIVYLYKFVLKYLDNKINFDRL